MVYRVERLVGIKLDIVLVGMCENDRERER